MKDAIRDTKEQILQRMQSSIAERGVERADVAELGMLADMVKDLADADESCWEAKYYEAVTGAMDGSRAGYGMGYAGGGMGYARAAQQGTQGRMGYDGAERDGIVRISDRRGYREYPYGHEDTMGELRQMMQVADPQERERLKMQLRQMADM